MYVLAEGFDRHVEITRSLSTLAITLAILTVIGLLEHQELSAINGANGTSSNGTAGLKAVTVPEVLMPMVLMVILKTV
jgi:hypothetical protein